MSVVPHSPSPPAGEGLGCGVPPRQAAQKTLGKVQSRRAALIKLARRMRANPTEAERKLWYLLRDKRLGELRWRRQEIIDDRYILDFVCYEHRLTVDADGSQHADSAEDVERDAWLVGQGFKVLRFWNTDILTNIDGVAESILHAVENIAAPTRGDPTPNPLPQGERAFGGN
jgi:very-short-patch-repair endonuclease